MEKTLDDWIKEISDSGLLCSEYKGKVDDAKSNKQLVDIVMDANGMSFLPEMSSKGIPLSYDLITTRFAPFINGKYIGHIKNDKGHEYTSAIYCRYDGDINDADTTLLTILDSCCTVNIAQNSYIHIYIDGNSTVQVHCPESSHAIVEYWKGAKVAFSDNVKCIAHGNV